MRGRWAGFLLFAALVIPAHAQQGIETNNHLPDILGPVVPPLNNPLNEIRRAINQNYQLFPVFNVEAYRLPTDPAGDDTQVIQRACDAAMEVNGAIEFGNRNYTTGRINLGVSGATNKCDLIGPSLKMPVPGQTTGTGATITLKAGTNDSMFWIPKEAEMVQIRNLLLDGNKANNTCSTDTAVVYLEDDPTTAKQRAVVMNDVRINNSCNDGIYGGRKRNAGVLTHVTIVAPNRHGITLGGTSDWRFFAVDTAGNPANSGYGLRCTACGSLTSVASNYFTSLAGVRMDANSFDNTFIGGSMDTNAQEGILLVGNAAADKQYTVNIIGVRFSANGTSANNTYSDIRLSGQLGCVVTGAYFMRGSDDATGGNREKYLIEADSTSNCVWGDNAYSLDSAKLPFQTAVTNDWSKLTLVDPRYAQNFHVDINSSAAARARISSPSTGSIGVIYGTEMVDGSAVGVPLRLKPGTNSRVSVEADDPELELNDTTAAADGGRSKLEQAGILVHYRLLNDARSASTTAWELKRTGTTLNEACWGGSVGATCPMTVDPLLGVLLRPYTVATLPTCNVAADGRVNYVTDANAPAYGAVLAGGGAVRALALCINGTGWTAH